MEELKISHTLIDRLLNGLRAYDPQCEDPLVAAQYLSAVCALLVAKNLPTETAAKDVLQQIFALMAQICESESTPTSTNSFGMWYPPGWKSD